MSFVVISIYTSPCDGEVVQCRGMFDDRSEAIEYVVQYYMDQNMSCDSDLAVLKEWLKRHLQSLDNESFF